MEPAHAMEYTSFVFNQCIIRTSSTPTGVFQADKKKLLLIDEF
jgi:hypothetical protein